jgi:hypothetical protein
VFVGIGGVTVSAGAHDCGCQEDNSGPGSTDSGSSGSSDSGSGSSGSGSSGPDNSGPGNACHDNSGPGSSGPDNSGPGNAEDDCPVDEPDDPGDSNDPGNGPSTSGSGSGNSATGTVVLGAQASAPTQAGATVPTAVNAGLAGEEESPSALAGLAILLGLAMTFGALVRRRTRV